MRKEPPPPPELDQSWQKTPGWRGQAARMRRWRDRCRLAKDPEEREDFLYAFFWSSANLADWLRSERAVAQQHLDGLLATSRELQLARDISNVTKHRDLQDPKAGREYSMARQYEDPPDGTLTPDSRLTIYSNGQWLDVFELMDRCAARWDAFLREHGLEAE